MDISIFAKFCKNCDNSQNFASRKYWYSKHFRKIWNFRENISFQTLSRPCYPVLSVLSRPRLSVRPPRPIQHVLAALFQLSSPRCPVLSQATLSTALLTRCHVLAILFSVLSKLTCPGCPVRPTVQTVLSRLPCPGYSVGKVLSQMSTATAVVSQLHCPCCHVCQFYLYFLS